MYLFILSIVQKVLNSFISKNSRTKNSQMASRRHDLIESIPYQMSINHEICNLDAYLLQNDLKCAFYGREQIGGNIHVSELEYDSDAKELFAVKNDFNNF